MSKFLRKFLKYIILPGFLESPGFFSLTSPGFFPGAGFGSGVTEPTFISLTERFGLSSCFVLVFDFVLN